MTKTTRAAIDVFEDIKNLKPPEQLRLAATLIEEAGARAGKGKEVDAEAMRLFGVAETITKRVADDLALLRLFPRKK